MNFLHHDPTEELPLNVPDAGEHQSFDNAREAVAHLKLLYNQSTTFLQEKFNLLAQGSLPPARYRAYYPEIRFKTTTYSQIDSRLSFGHVTGPGDYFTTITRPDLFNNYLATQIDLLLQNHQVPVSIGPSNVPMPLHFAFPEGHHVEGAVVQNREFPLRDLFDAPDLGQSDDRIANGEIDLLADGPNPLAPFTAPRIDYSLHRLAHYTGTSPKWFQNFVLFTNYQFYVDEFVAYAKAALNEPGSTYDCFTEPGNVVYEQGKDEPTSGSAPVRQPQMSAYHLVRKDNNGITLVNIGVGPSNAKTITDHIAVLRPFAWLMLGHCAGLRNSQSLGDYVLAHGYVRDDHVLDADLPTWIPIPALAEVQVALEQAVAEITGLSGYELKKIMRTGTVATTDNRNWELRDQNDAVQRLSQSRAIGMDMESATIAANGFRFRVPYGTLLCVSDKPLHGELKLPGMATDFYNRQISQHLLIGIKALEKLRAMPHERLHSRKLRAFDETAFQ